MLLLHSFLYFFFSGGLLAGISDCVNIVLGNNPAMSALALGFCLTPLALGMRFCGAGHVPARASFILLGLSGILPSIAHFNFIAIGLAGILILPLRAWGANLNMIARTCRSETTYLLLAGLLGFVIFPYFLHGTIGFTLVWAATILIQQKALKANKKDEKNHQPFQSVTFFAGCAVTALALSLAPIITVLDYATVQNQLARHLTIILVLAIVWFTIASPLTNWQRKKVQFVSGLALAVGAVFLREHVIDLCKTDVFSRWFSDPRILSLLSIDTRFLPEESFWFVPYATVISLAIPITIGGIFIRTHITAAGHASSWLLGVGATLILASVLPYPANVNYFTPLAIVFSLYATMPKHLIRASIAAISLIFFFNPQALTNPKISSPVKDIYNWETSSEHQDKFYITSIRRQLIMNNNLYEFDGRSIISQLPNDPRSWNGIRALTERLSTEKDIVLSASHQWLPRRSLLRSELFHQTARDLDKNNKLFFTIPIDECQPTILPQLIQEVRDNFLHVSIFLYSESANIPFLLIIASDSNFIFPKLGPFKLNLNSNIGSNPLLLKGPWRLSQKLMGLSVPRLIEEMQRFNRSITTLEELHSYSFNNTASVLDFFLLHLGAQEYSVHDTYLSKNPLDTECSIDAINILIELSKKHPDSDYLKILWENIFVLLVESREISWLEKSVNALYEIDWNDSFITIGEIHVCLEKLEFKTAEILAEDVLKSEPQHVAAQELLQLAKRKEQVPRDSHAGHNH